MADYSDTIQQAAQSWNVDPALLQAVVQQESGGKPGAVSKAGARGLTGLMPATAQGMGVTDLSDPVQQIYGGAKYLSQALDATKSPEEALLYYHGGPGWQQAYGPESAAYPGAVTQQYLTLKKQSQAPQQVPQQGAPAQGGSDPFTQALKGGLPKGPTQTSGMGSDPFSAALADAQKATETQPAQSTPAGQTTADGLAKNIAAGATDAGANAINIASDPFGNLVGKPLATALVAAHDFVAPMLGGQRYPDDVRNMLLGDQVAQPGTKLVGAIANATGIDPSAVPANSPAERIARKVTGNALTAAMASPAAIVPSAAGAVAGDQAAQYAPDWAKPVAELAGNVAGAGVAAPTAILAGKGIDASANALNRFAAGADETARNPLTPGAAAANPAPTIEATNPLSAAPTASPAYGSGAATQAKLLLTDLGRRVASGDMTVEQARAVLGQVSKAEMAQRPQPSPDTNATASANPLAPETGTANPLSTAPDSAAPQEAPQPQSAGAAAASPEEAQMTPEQVQAYRSTAEGTKLLEPQQPGIRDQNLYVPGVTTNSAEIEQSVNTAREMKALNVTAPDVSQEAKEIAADNNGARQRYFEGLAGSHVDVDNATAQRAAQADSDLAMTWANKQEADAQPVVDAANEIKASPDGRRPIVRKLMDSVTGELYDANGDMITDPEQLYGVRKHVDDLLSNEGTAKDPLSVRAKANLLQLKDQLDSVITQATTDGDGNSYFQTYLKNFSDASQRIDEMQALQGFEKKLYDSQIRMTHGKVQNMMRQVVDSRQAPGLNPYKSISETTMQKLWNLRDDLRRSASAQELARTPGSDTTQTAFDVAKQLAGEGALHVGANFVAPVAGSVILGGLKAGAAPILKAYRAGKATQRGMQLLRPDQSQLRNPLNYP